MSRDAEDEDVEAAEPGDVAELMSAAVRRLRNIAASAFDPDLGPELWNVAAEG